MVILDFSCSNSPQYSLLCSNESESNWFFYVFQRINNQKDHAIYSLTWLASPYKVSPKSYMKFIWSEDFCFNWKGPGKLAPGAIFQMGGIESAFIQSENKTTFNLKNKAPGFTDSTSGQPSDKFIINIANDVPNLTFSTGTGMSNQGCFVKQSAMNTDQQFDPKINYWIGASANIQMGQVLSQDQISNAKSFSFPTNIYSLKAILGQDNEWKVS